MRFRVNKFSLAVSIVVPAYLMHSRFCSKYSSTDVHTHLLINVPPIKKERQMSGSSMEPLRKSAREAVMPNWFSMYLAMKMTVPAMMADAILWQIKMPTITGFVTSRAPTQETGL